MWTNVKLAHNVKLSHFKTVYFLSYFVKVNKNEKYISLVDFHSKSRVAFLIFRLENKRTKNEGYLCFLLKVDF